MIRYIIAVCTIFLCGCSAKATGTAAAIIIPAPTSGYTCFGIVDQDGKIAGGNCVKE
jgi:hypothetical protein